MGKGYSTDRVIFSGSTWTLCYCASPCTCSPAALVSYALAGPAAPVDRAHDSYPPRVATHAAPPRQHPLSNWRSHCGPEYRCASRRAWRRPTLAASLAASQSHSMPDPDTHVPHTAAARAQHLKVPQHWQRHDVPDVQDVRHLPQPNWQPAGCSVHWQSDKSKWCPPRFPVKAKQWRQKNENCK